MSISKNGVWKQDGAPNKNYILNSAFTNRTDAGIFSFNDDEVTFESDVFQASNHSFYLSLDSSAKTDFRNKKLTFSMEYKIDTSLEFGTTNPWVGFEVSINRNTTTGGSNQWLDWYGGKSIPTTVTNGWVRYAVTVTVTDYDISGVGVNFYFRDTKGKISYRHPKIEIGSYTTAWIPNESDIIYIGERQGFIENNYNNLKTRIHKNGYLEANSFIEI